jgi:hypothetical protein
VHGGLPFEHVGQRQLNHHQLDLTAVDPSQFHLIPRQFLDQRPIGVKVAGGLLLRGELRRETAKTFVDCRGWRRKTHIGLPVEGVVEASQ